jgi:hypothetical protein
VKEYFSLQYKMTYRRLRDAGVEPIFAYIFLPIGFYGLSIFLFKKSDFAEYIYIFFALNVISILSEARRIEFLNVCFGDEQFKKIRITENLILSIPFVLFLIYKQFFIHTLFILLASIILALVKFRTKFNYTIFTPFSKRPFEFTTGFRNMFPLFIIAYLLAVFAISMGFYLNPENEYFVWIYGMNPKKFLFSKMKTAILFSSTLVLPIVILLSVIFPKNIGFLFLFISFGWAFLVCTIVTKYSFYPNEITIPQILLLGLCIGLPPMLVILIPYMFLKAENRLKKILK